MATTISMSQRCLPMCVDMIGVKISVKLKQIKWLLLPTKLHEQLPVLVYEGIHYSNLSWHELYHFPPLLLSLSTIQAVTLSLRNYIRTINLYYIYPTHQWRTKHIFFLFLCLFPVFLFPWHHKCQQPTIATAKWVRPEWVLIDDTAR